MSSRTICISFNSKCFSKASYISCCSPAICTFSCLKHFSQVIKESLLLLLSHQKRFISASNFHRVFTAAQLKLNVSWHFSFMLITSSICRRWLFTFAVILDAADFSCYCVWSNFDVLCTSRTSALTKYCKFNLYLTAGVCTSSVNNCYY